MIRAARARGLEYVAITDHSKALAMANGLDEKRAVAFAHQVREMDQRELGVRVFSGLECDILRDGKMDLADDALAELAPKRVNKVSDVVNEGDLVEIAETRPLSKQKRWRIVEVLERAR